MRVVFLTSAALVAFAANSLLTRAALGPALIDPASFTLIRLATGAATLAALLRLRRGPRRDTGTWQAAFALAAYAVTFTIAYAHIDAAAGALLLFGAVQLTMTITGIARGERPRALDWIGVGLAVSGLLVLTVPGAMAPDALGATLMIAGGISWGAFSLFGRSSRDSLAATAANFLHATVLALLSLAWFLRETHATTGGVLMAAASGSLASGIGYTFWYAVLPSLAAWRAALVQLIVPVITAFGAVALLDEKIGARLVTATALTAVGVGITTVKRKK